jgi:hypothetical protein
MVQAPFLLHIMAMWFLFPGKDFNLYLLKKKKHAGQQRYEADFTMLCCTPHLLIQWKPLIITLGSALFDKNNLLITLSGGYKNLHYLTQFIVTTFYMYKKTTKFI